MIKEHDFGSTKWFQLLNPTIDEIREIIRNFEIDPSVAQDIASPTPKQKPAIGGKEWVGEGI